MILPLLKTIFAEIGLKHPDTGDEGNGKVKTFIIDVRQLLFWIPTILET